MEILLSLLSSICLGLHNGIAKKPLKNLTPTQLFFWREVVVVLIMFPITISNLPVLEAPEIVIKKNIFWAVLAGFIGYFVVVLLYRGIRVGNPGLIGAISNSYLPCVMGISFIFLGERFSLPFIPKASLIFFGMLLITLPKNLLERQSSKGIFYGFCAMGAYSVLFPFFKSSTVVLTPILASFLMRAFGFFTGAISMKLIKQKFTFPKKDWKTILVLGILMTVTIFSLAFALSVKEGKLSLVVAIMGANPLITVAYSHFVYGMKISLKQFVGVILTILGIALLAI